MDNNSEQLELKKVLVDLEDQHQHLQASIGHLEQEIKKRELDIQKLVAERELELVNSKNLEINNKNNDILDTQHEVNTNLDIQQSDSDSAFAKEVGLILNKITKTCQEVSSLIRL